MIADFRLQMQAEINTLEDLLLSTPAESAIARYSLESRLKTLREKLKDAANGMPPSERMALTFRGRPVRGSEAVGADFAGKASSAFVDAFSAILASMKGTLHESGPVPSKGHSPLVITGVATGSFGFEMELPNENGELFEAENKAVEAIKTLKELFRQSAEGSDDAVSDLVETLHPRAVRKVADFLGTVAKAGAWCGVQFRENFFKYDSLEQLKLAEQRLRKIELSEHQDEFVGHLTAAFPVARTFEFVLEDNNSVIHGKVGDGIKDVDELNREWRNRHVVATLTVTRLGEGRPRYRLNEISNLEPV